VCTVSIVPCGQNLTFTFNRDEHPNRTTPEYLSSVQLLHKKIYFAKDVKANGSWFVVDDKGNIAMLFNGAFNKHIKEPLYRKSRGLILLDIFSSKYCSEAFALYDCTNVEPFSIILYENKNLYRLVWDGKNKETTVLNKTENHIFSSCTIYTKEIQQARKNWLQNYFELNNTNAENILLFHTNYKSSDKENGLVMKRNEILQTLSISQAIIEEDFVYLQHNDLVENKVYKEKILFT
jgi:Transport and Golgi organisation 2